MQNAEPGPAHESGNIQHSTFNVEHPMKDQQALADRARHSPRHRMSGSVRAFWRCTGSRATHHVRGGQGTARPTHEPGNIQHSTFNVEHPMKDQQALADRARHSPRHRMSGSVRAFWRCTGSRATHHVRGGQGTARPTHEPGNIQHSTSNEGKDPSPHRPTLPPPPKLRRAGRSYGPTSPDPFHEPDVGARVCDPQQLGLQGDVLRLTEPRSVPAARFMVPMHAKDRKEALHEQGNIEHRTSNEGDRKRPPHPGPLPRGGEGVSELREYPTSNIKSGWARHQVIRKRRRRFALPAQSKSSGLLTMNLGTFNIQHSTSNEGGR